MYMGNYWNEDLSQAIEAIEKYPEAVKDIMAIYEINSKDYLDQFILQEEAD